MLTSFRTFWSRTFTVLAGSTLVFLGWIMVVTVSSSRLFRLSRAHVLPHVL